MLNIFLTKCMAMPVKKKKKNGNNEEREITIKKARKKLLNTYFISLAAQEYDERERKGFWMELGAVLNLDAIYCDRNLLTAS